MGTNRGNACIKFPDAGRSIDNNRGPAVRLKCSSLSLLPCLLIKKEGHHVTVQNTRWTPLFLTQVFRHLWGMIYLLSLNSLWNWCLVKWNKAASYFPLFLLLHLKSQCIQCPFLLCVKNSRFFTCNTFAWLMVAFIYLHVRGSSPPLMMSAIKWDSR